MSEIIVSTEYQRAIELDAEIKSKAQFAQKSLYEVCNGLKEMRDNKLYKELGYQNFEDYCEQEVGISRRNAYRYISIAENLSNDFVTSMSQIGTTKLSLLSKMTESERTEIIENNDLENTSVRELEQKIKALEDVNNSLEEKNNELKHRYEDCSDKLDDAVSENKSLLAQIDELENRPVDVAVSDNSHEIENMRKAMEKKDIEIQRQFDELEQKSWNEHNEHQRELNRVKEEYEQKLAEAYASAKKSESAPDTEQVFRAYYANAVDSITRLINFIKSQSDKETYITKANALSDRLIKELED